MKIYFVRHGESELNAKGIHQFGHTALSTLGQRQAKYVAKRFSDIPIDAIYTSDYVRAHQTAEAIGKHIGVPVTTNAFLRELKRPTEIEGKSESDPVVSEIKKKIIANFHDPTWHHSDEENLYDFARRCKKFILELDQMNHHTVLVVSHGLAIRMIISLMMYPEDKAVDFLETFWRFMHISNTGITIVEREEVGKYHLLTWNDYAHLG